jgi:hypothetical protein
MFAWKSGPSVLWYDSIYFYLKFDMAWTNDKCPRLASVRTTGGITASEPSNGHVDTKAKDINIGQHLKRKSNHHPADLAPLPH